MRRHLFLPATQGFRPRRGALVFGASSADGSSPHGTQRAESRARAGPPRLPSLACAPRPVPASPCLRGASPRRPGHFVAHLHRLRHRPVLVEVPARPPHLELTPMGGPYVGRATKASSVSSAASSVVPPARRRSGSEAAFRPIRGAVYLRGTASSLHAVEPWRYPDDDQPWTEPPRPRWHCTEGICPCSELGTDRRRLRVCALAVRSQG